MLLFEVGRLQLSWCDTSSVSTLSNTTTIAPPWRRLTTASKAYRCCSAHQTIASAWKEVNNGSNIELLLLLRCWWLHCREGCPFRRYTQNRIEVGFPLTALAALARENSSSYIFLLRHHSYVTRLAVCKKFWVAHLVSSCGGVNSFCRLVKVVTSGKI